MSFVLTLLVIVAILATIATLFLGIWAMVFDADLMVGTDAEADDVLRALGDAVAAHHTSVVLRDALAGVAIPFFEVHVSNVHKRESFRHHSFLSEIAAGVIVGFGVAGYTMALNAAIDRLAPD